MPQDSHTGIFSFGARLTPAEVSSIDVLTPPPNKRRREDDHDARIWTCHPDLWLTRGDIVIVCDTTGFCVSQCVLSLNSSVFQSMFVTVDPSQNETYEDLSVLRLHDPADDMYHLLKAMHFRQYVRKTSRPGFKALAAIVQLSTKYMIDDLREEAVDALTLIFPSSLAAWTDSKIHYLPPDLDAMYAVELAKQHDVPIILPAACHLASLRTARRISTTKKSKASNATRWTCATFRDEFATVAYNAMSKSRSEQDSRHVQHGALGARSWRECDIGCCALTESSFADIEQGFQHLALNDIFSPVLGRMHPRYNKICKVMRSRIDQYWLMAQGTVWDALPSLCGYKDWAAVNAAQAAIAGSKA